MHDGSSAVCHYNNLTNRKGRPPKCSVIRFGSHPQSMVANIMGQLKDKSTAELTNGQHNYCDTISTPSTCVMELDQTEDDICHKLPKR